jgi:hypothetical protein
VVDQPWIDKIADGEEAPPPDVMREVPKGALTLAALTVALLIVCWLAVYLLVFLPRGAVS